MIRAGQCRRGPGAAWTGLWGLLATLAACGRSGTTNEAALLPASRCPSVALAVAAMDGAIEDSTAVSAGPSDDVDPAAPVIYKWTASAGRFADPTAPRTTYWCPRSLGPSPQTITLTASRGPCTVTQQLVVICIPPPLPADGAGGAIQRGTGGRSGAGEPGNDDAGATDDSGGSPADAGADGPAEVGGGALVCGQDDSTVDEGDTCNQCTFANCTTLESVGPKAVVTAGCHHLAADADRVRCEQLYCCIRAHHCLVGGDPTSCWCGDADPAACALGTARATGPCLAEAQAAAGTVDLAQINQSQVDPTLAIGGAVNLAICRFTYCASPPSPACAGFPE